MSDAPFPYAGPQALREPILVALRRVVDREVAMNIVDVGLICGVTVTDEKLHVQVWRLKYGARSARRTGE